jgi:hypothetical protein
VHSVTADARCQRVSLDDAPEDKEASFERRPVEADCCDEELTE